MKIKSVGKSVICGSICVIISVERCLVSVEPPPTPQKDKPNMENDQASEELLK